MFNWQTWQLAIIVCAGLASIGWMSAALVRLSTRRAACSAITRVATDVESALVGGVIPEGTRVFDCWSYRVGARFAGRVRVAIGDDHVAVAGPRVPRGLYWIWMWAQGLMLALVVPAAVAAAVTLDWRWLVAATAIFIGSFVVSMGGAGLWPGLGELFVDSTGHFGAVEFALSSIREVDIGKGWSKGGLGTVLFPYEAAVDRMAEGRAVSFFAPDEDGREVRFAVDAFTPERAQELSSLLDGSARR